MIAQVFNELSSPIEFLKRGWRAVRHTRAFIDEIDAKGPDQRHACIVAMLLGSVAAVTVLVAALKTFANLSTEFSVEQRLLMAAWLGLALVLHFGLVVMAVPNRTWARTMELSGVWFSVSLFGLAAVMTAFFLGGYLVEYVAHLVLNFDECLPGDGACNNSQLMNVGLATAFGLAWALFLPAGLYLLGVASGLYAATVFAYGYRIHAARSAAAVTISYVLAILVLVLALIAAAPTRLRDTLMEWPWTTLISIDLRTAEERFSDAKVTADKESIEDLRSDWKFQCELDLSLASDESKDANPVQVAAYLARCVKRHEAKHEAAASENELVENRAATPAPEPSPTLVARILNPLFVLCGADISPGRVRKPIR